MQRKRHIRFVAPVLLLLAACGSSPAPSPEARQTVVETAQSAPEAVAGISSPGWASDADAAEHAEELGRWYSHFFWLDTVAENERAAAEAAAAATHHSPSSSAPSSSAGVGMGPCQSGGYTSGWGPGTCNGYACGGNLPPCCVMAGESGGNPYAENSSSSASGLWQVIDSTWNGYGGYSHASNAPVSVQQAQAAMLFAGGSGAGHWAATIGCAG